MRHDLKYLVYLAELGKSNLHPHGKDATGCLIDELRIENGDKLLEIGCGTGETLIRILSTHTVTIDAIDLLPEMLKKASFRIKLMGSSKRARLHNITVNEGFPFENEYYDKIYAESVLGFQNEETLIKLLKEIHRVLKRGGLFAANDAIWKKDTLRKDAERINNSCIEDFGLSQASRQSWNIDDWLNIFKEAGFEILSFNLISDLLENKNVHNYSRDNYKIYMSALISKYFHLRGLLSPSVRQQSKNFKYLLKKHADDGKYIESRLFILRKN